MANFTDFSILPQLTQHKGYVSQMPLVEAYSVVGREKQQMYDQGIQKIQGQIDQVAGMDVVRDVDKQYLNSKLNELSGNLKHVAAGDFSNYQLVNSVGGMVNSIARDKNIQNAVGSTARYRKGLADMESSIKEGKSSPSNEWDFQTQASQWLNNTDPSTSFSGRYNPYTNYKKNALEVLKSLTKDETITDDAFTFDNNGNVVIADAIVRKKLSGIDPNKVQQALMATLTPADFKQMEIDGRYNYSNVAPEQFIRNTSNNYTEKKQFFEKQKATIKNALDATKSLSEKAKLNDQISTLDKTLDNINSEYENINQMFSSGNIEGAKSQLHTINFLNDFSKSFSYTETSQTYQDSPFVKNEHWKKEMERDWMKFQISNQYKDAELALKLREVNLKDKEVNGQLGGLPQSIPQEKLPSVTVPVIKEKIQTEQQILSVADGRFFKQKGYDVNTLQGKAAADEYMTQMLDKYSKSPNSVDSQVKLHIENTRDLRRQIDGNKQLLLNTRLEVGEELGIGNPDDYIYNLIPEEAPTAQYNGNYFSPEDFIEFNSKFKPTGFETGVITKKRQDEFVKGLSDKEKALFDIYTAKNRGYLNPEQRQLSDIGKFYQENVNDPNDEMLDNVIKLTNEKLKEKVIVSQGVSRPITDKGFSNILTQFADKADDQGGNLPNAIKWDSKLAREIASSESSEYSITVADRGQFQEPTYIVSASTKAGDQNVRFYMTEEEKRGVFGTKYESPENVQYVKPYIEQLTAMGGSTTSFDGNTTNTKNSYLDSQDFPSVNNYGVSGNLISGRDKSGRNLYQLRINIFDPIEEKWHENIEYPSKWVTMEMLQESFKQLSDPYIHELIYGQDKPMTKEDQKRLQEASKKPF